jgi:hypothetical protein
MRLMTTVAALSLAALNSGCQTVAQQPAEDDPVGWARFDCQRSSHNPVLEGELERAKLVCNGRAEAAAIAGTAHIRPGYSMGSAIVAGVEAGQKQTQISHATGTSRMAEYGYRLSKRSEFVAVCPLPPPAPSRSAKKVSTRTAP